MELLLEVQPPAGEPRAVLVDADAMAPLHAVIAEVVRHLGVTPLPGAARRDRDGRWLDLQIAVGESGLRDGDRLVLATSASDGATVGPEPSGAPVVADLVVVGGPDAGLRVPLVAGSYVVGRGPGADVTVADRSLSRRHLRLEVAASQVTLVDAGSTNGTYVDGMAIDAARTVAAGELIEAGRSLLAVERPDGDGRPATDTIAGQIAFNRPPRVVRAPPAARFEAPAPPAELDRPSAPVGPMLIPVALGGLLFAITRNPLTAMFALMTPALALWSFFDRRRAGGRTHERDRGRFDEAIADVAARVEAARADELETRRSAAPDAAELERRVATLDERLWERRVDDPDALELRVGVADLPSRIEAELAPGGDPEVRADAEQRLAGGAELPSVPVTVRAGVVGIAGPRRHADALARWLVIQAAVLHSPADVRLGAAMPPDAAHRFDWMAWLPHARGPGRLELGEAGARRVLDAAASWGGCPLVVIDGDLETDHARLHAAIDDGLRLIWLGRERRDLPSECTQVVVLDEQVDRLEVTDVATGTTIGSISADGLTDDAARRIARMLAPIRDRAVEGAAGVVPKRVSLLESLGLDVPDPEAIAERWARGDRALSAPIGVTVDGSFAVDVGAVEGLRLLVAGMPGTGKSELLQTMVAALASSHPPERLTFLLVDYKGGAAFRDCVELPHVVGLITDLDAHLADRCRISLLAELRRREALLKEAGARSLRELARRDPELAPPSLLIVVDEFATLVKELPAFVDTVIDVAQRGRSLGLHLVLATQRPRGAINDTIRANANLRIALRVADAAESQDILDAPDAAAIPAAIPGRAVALAGREADGSPRLVELQVAYGGGRSGFALETARTVTVTDLGFGVGAVAAARRGFSATGGLGATDLQVLSEAIRGAAGRLGLAPPPSPWLPPLPEGLDLADLQQPAAAHAAVVGLVDDPERQRRAPLAVDLARDGSALVYGASGSGRTTFLRTLAAALAQRSDPAQLHVYGLDFASRGLAPLEDLPQCAAVIAGDDLERVVRLFRRLARATAQRKALLADVGEPDVTALARRADLGPDQLPPRVVVLLDGYAAFAATCEGGPAADLPQALVRVVADGRPLGLHVVITADRRGDVPSALSGAVPLRFILRLADRDEYTALGLPRTRTDGVALPPGRGFTAEGLEFQAAVVGGVPELEREALIALAESARERAGTRSAPRVGVLPARVRPERLPAPTSRLAPVIGVGDGSLQPVALDLSHDHALVVGPRRSGRTSALVAVRASLARASSPCRVAVLAPRGGGLADAAGEGAAVGPEACAAAAERLATALGAPSTGEAGAPLVILVDDAQELAEGAAATPLATLMGAGREAGVRIVAAAEAHAVHRLYGGWLRDLRAAQHGLLLLPDVDVDGDLLSVRLPRRSATPLGPGRGYLVQDGTVELMQVAAG
jgi:DNA segregation ATPase FtsK/SpoIIIE, S-DNA-T family